MNKGLMTSLLVLLAGAGSVLGQPPEAALPGPSAGTAAAPGANLLANAPPASHGPGTPQSPLLAPFPAALDFCRSLWGGPFHHAGLPSYVSLDAAYTIWYFPSSRDQLPLISTGIAGTPFSSVIGGIGDSHLGDRTVSGGRFAIGYWEARENPWVPGEFLRAQGAEARIFFTGQQSVNLSVDKIPILVRPFFDLNNNVESAVPVAAAGLGSGSIAASARGNFWGTDANLWKNIYFNTPGTGLSVDVMTGFRYLNLNSTIAINRFTLYDSTIVGFPQLTSLAGNLIQERESFLTHNHFYGGQIGLAGHAYLDPIIINGRVQLGLGVTHQEIGIDGGQLRVAPDGTATLSQGALLALPSNIGRHSRNRFTPIPEFGVDIALPLLERLTLSVGFSALYWSRLVLPGNQVDRSIDITQIPSFPPGAGATPTGLGRPAVPFRQSDLWILATTISAEFKW